MGEYADEMYAYAEKVNEVVGIDPSEWIRNGCLYVNRQQEAINVQEPQLGYDLSSLELTAMDCNPAWGKGDCSEMRPQTLMVHRCNGAEKDAASGITMLESRTGTCANPHRIS